MGIVIKKSRHTRGAIATLTVQYLIPQFKRKTTTKNKIITPESKWKAAILKYTKDNPWTGSISSEDVIHVSGIIYFACTTHDVVELSGHTPLHTIYQKSPLRNSRKEVRQTTHEEVE
jgi:hypothetical protein